MNKEQLATFLDMAREKWIDPLANVNGSKLHNLIFVLTEDMFEDFRMLEFSERDNVISEVFEITQHDGIKFYFQVILNRGIYYRNQEEYADYEECVFFKEVKPKKIQGVDYEIYETVAPVERLTPHDERNYLKNLPQYLRDYLPEPFKSVERAKA